MDPTPRAPRTLYAAAGRSPADPAVECESTVLSWGELEERTNAVGRGSEGLGLVPGDHVAVAAGNRIEVIEALLGVQKAGMVVSPLKASWTAGEIGQVLDDAGTRLLVTDSDAGRAAAASRRIAILDLDRGYSAWLQQQSVTPFWPERQGWRMSWTSGTTGRPKGVVRRVGAGGSFLDGFARGQAMAAMLGLPGEGIHLIVSALSHGAPLAFALSALGAGARMRIVPRWDADLVLAELERGVTSTAMVPTMFRRLLAVPAGRRAAFVAPSLRQVLHGGEPCPVEVKRRMIEWWGPVFTEYFGASEGGMTLASSAEWTERPGSVGRPLPNWSCRILDERGLQLPPGREGRVFFAAADGARAFEYLRDPAKTESAHEGESFTVGDIGWLDEDGHLFLSGRVADIIVSAGVNIYPAEVEEALAAVDGVADAAVCAGPDPERGENVVAFLVPAAGHRHGDLAARAELMCAERLAAYKRPRRFLIRDQLPRDGTGKLLRRQLREELFEGGSTFAAAPPSR